MTRLYRSACKTPSLWLEPVWICALVSSDTGGKGKTTCLNGKPYASILLKSCTKSTLIYFKIPGTKRVNHTRAVKMYERAAGDKTLPSDLRPPKVLKVGGTVP